VILQHCLAAEHANRALIGIEIVESGLEQLRLRTAFIHEQPILLVDVRHFDGRLPSLHRDLCTSQVRRDHFHRARVPNPQKDSRRQQHLGLALRGRQRLPLRQGHIAD